jgi:DNA polymerase-3 subunit epsilon
MNTSNLVAVDVETSGLSPFKHQLLAVGLCPFQDVIDPITVYVRHTTVNWTDNAKRYFSKYQYAWEREALEPPIACAKIEAFFRRVSPNRPVQLLGHNIGFDSGFLRQLANQSGKDELVGASHRTIDTHTMLFLLNRSGLVPDSAMKSDGAFEYFGIKVEDSDRHTASGDAIATRDLALAIFALFDKEFRSRSRGMFVLGAR